MAAYRRDVSFVGGWLGQWSPSIVGYLKLKAPMFLAIHPPCGEHFIMRRMETLGGGISAALPSWCGPRLPEGCKRIAMQFRLGFEV